MLTANLTLIQVAMKSAPSEPSKNQPLPISHLKNFALISSPGTFLLEWAVLL